MEIYEVCTKDSITLASFQELNKAKIYLEIVKKITNDSRATIRTSHLLDGLIGREDGCVKFYGCTLDATVTNMSSTFITDVSPRYFVSDLDILVDVVNNRGTVWSSISGDHAYNVAKKIAKNNKRNKPFISNLHSINPVYRTLEMFS